jgi:2'-5' RNA ligase
MYGIVSLLDAEHHAKVVQLWAEFKARFGVQGISLTPIPHYSYHVAEKYNLAKLEAVLVKAARTIQPFRVRTNGLGIFTGAEPVLYIPVIRKPALTQFHQYLWEPLSATATKSSPYYHPDSWRPHITLTHRDVNHDLLPQVVRLLSERTFYWDVGIETLSVLSSNEEPDETVMMTVKLGTGEVVHGRGKAKPQG